MSSLAEVPVEVILDNLLPVIPVPDLLRLASTNKLFASVCADDTFWKRKLQTDFNFSGAGTARTTGWKFIYRGLSNPKVFVWGEKSHGRLGLSKLPNSTIPDVPFPTQLRIPGVRVVSLIAAGMSFHALDSDGNIYVWGTLDGTGYALTRDGFSQPGKEANIPMRLHMPAPTRSISCGRLHSSSLDVDRKVWTFVNWGRPFWLSSPILNDPDLVPIQVECGWGFSSLLTKSGDVFVWWPFSGVLEQHIRRLNDEMDRQDKKALPTSNNVIPCVTLSINVDPLRLPPLPPLPELNATGGEIQLIQIAALDAHIIGLTNKGHVVKFGALENEAIMSRGVWQYLPKFSEVKHVQNHPSFLHYDNAYPNETSAEPPQTMQITHISGHFLHFVAYSTGSSSIVLMGDTNTTPDSDPNIIPALQNRSVISVVLGDYHNGALTSSGKLLTWGAYSAGALGLGDPASLEPGTPGAFSTEAQRIRALGHHRGVPPAVEVPTEVRFDHGRKEPKERFCFSASASGWHTGALVIDLEPDGDSDTEEVATSSSSGNRSVPRLGTIPTIHGPGQSPPILPSIFRVGYAGRGGHAG